jgi:glycogen synthase
LEEKTYEFNQLFQRMYRNLLLPMEQDIIHCHDWSSAPVAWLFKEQYTHYGLSKARAVFTIHNLEFGAALIAKAMAFADKATTVSAAYSLNLSITL